MDTHNSGGFGRQFFLRRMQRDQLLPQFEAGLLGLPARQVADRRLSDAALGCDLCLHHAPGRQVSDQLFPVHGSALNHRDADIVSTGLPIVNIGKLIGVKSKERTPFGQRLYDARKRAKLTQEQVAKAIGIGQSTLAELERSAQGSSRAVELAGLYRCDALWLTTGEESGAPAPPPAGYADRHEVSESDWALLQDLKTVFSPEELRAIQDKAKAAQDRALAILAERKGR